MNQSAQSAHAPKRKGKSKKKNKGATTEDGSPAAAEPHVDDDAVSQADREVEESAVEIAVVEDGVVATEEATTAAIEMSAERVEDTQTEIAEELMVNGKEEVGDVETSQDIRQIINGTGDRPTEGTTEPTPIPTSESPRQDETPDTGITELAGKMAAMEEAHRLQVAELEGKLSHALDDNQQLDDKYRGLLGKVATIRTTLGDRLKQDAEELADCRATIESLQEQSSASTARTRELEVSLSVSQKQVATLNKEVSTLRDRLVVSTQNWVREREELESSESYIREEYELARKSMQDWEVLAMEESSVKKALRERCDDLEEQLSSLREAFEHMVRQRKKEAGAVEGLQRVLEEVQTERKRELKEYVAGTQAELEGLREEKISLQGRLHAVETKLIETQGQLHESSHFESEVREKSLAIGKLRHEGVILNEHLTRALKMLSKSKLQDNVDRQLITNLLLKFLALPRGDPKKYEVLQLIASFLNMSDEQREAAGLARPGTSGSVSGTGSISRASPFRTPSASMLVPDSPSVNKESLAELWKQFLDHEADRESTKSPQVPPPS